MLERRTDKAQAAVIAGMVLVGLWAWQQLPQGELVAVHFNVRGQPDGWEPAGKAFILMPGVAAATWGLGKLLLRIDPRSENLKRSAGAVSWVFLCVTLLLGALQGLIVSSALSATAPGPGWGIVLVGATLVGIGNVMGKLRHNYTVGVRTPWALADERIWERTQRLGGRSMVVGGLLLCAMGFAPLPPEYDGPALVAVALGMALLPMVASYLWWRQLNRSQGGGPGARKG